MPILASAALLFLSALLLTLALTPAVRAAAAGLGAVDYPDEKRKIHTQPIPKLGGIGIFVAFYTVALGILPFVQSDAAVAAVDLARRCFVPACLILILGICDDLWPVKPWMKLAVQILAALLICWYPDLRIAKLSNPFGMTIGGFGVLSIPLTVVWIVLITNAFNIVDGVDGLASGVAVVTTTCLFVAAIQLPTAFIPLLAAPLGGALVGFLRYNFQPASIFLGDSGSLFVGFLIAILSLASETKSSAAIAVAAPLLSLALPLIETVVSMLRRLLRGQPIWEADSGHIHHQLIKKGLSVRRAALVLYAGSAMFGAGSLLLDSNRLVGAVITIALVVVAWLGIRQLGYSEFTEVHHALKRGFLFQRRIIQNSIIVRKLSEDLQRVQTPAAAWPLLIDVIERLRFARARFVVDVAHEGRVATCEVEGCPNWVSNTSHAAGGDWLKASVHIDAGGLSPMRIELWRSSEEEPLHSELAILFDVINGEFPRLFGDKRSGGPNSTYDVTFDPEAHSSAIARHV
jgi:UDP-GlcNAc:undecaprenyl-phosphate GlcNAc-1-phosphate transferase